MTALDLSATRHHLELLAGKPDPIVAWQVFDDTKRNPSLARGFHGRLDDVLPQLIEAQGHGCGVYVAVNQTDGKRRRIENMRRARAIFLDLDGAPLPNTWPAAPDLLIHSSSVDGADKYQAWWLIEPTDDWTRWRAMQIAMVDRYGGDPKCTIMTQVGRVPGFYHLKRPDQPWLVSIISDNAIDETVRWRLDALAEKFGFDLASIKVPVSQRRQIDRPPPMHGWDNGIDVVAARRLVANEENWTRTSDGAFSIFRMACRLHDLGISQTLATELIEQHVPALPANAERDNRYVERKVANAYRYAQNNAGAWSHEADRQELIGKLVDRDALSAFLDSGGSDE